ncbi:ORF144 [Saltwater crocodilepox virus]|nr:hypothetical protein [Saltwater crocodilepox virus]AVD69479.1 hypothetical protein [Saltwater crocodilepox virus]QGT46582.1 ORF144 [Saltwater crocodilepox virus]QGT46798.1 ORF144 [Saltwater crocodilepox virus]QGT47014.1 ORF144 [Saltwater crocodilepox virus]
MATSVRTLVYMSVKIRWKLTFSGSSDSDSEYRDRAATRNARLLPETLPAQCLNTKSARNLVSSNRNVLKDSANCSATRGSRRSTSKKTRTREFSSSFLRHSKSVHSGRARMYSSSSGTKNDSQRLRLPLARCSRETPIRFSTKITLLFSSI